MVSLSTLVSYFWLLFSPFSLSRLSLHASSLPRQQKKKRTLGEGLTKTTSQLFQLKASNRLVLPIRKGYKRGREEESTHPPPTTPTQRQDDDDCFSLSVRRLLLYSSSFTYLRCVVYEHR